MIRRARRGSVVMMAATLVGISITFSFCRDFRQWDYTPTPVTTSWTDVTR